MRVRKAPYLFGKSSRSGVACAVRTKVSTLEEGPSPTTKKELLRVLGLVSYYHGFSTNFSAVLASYRPANGEYSFCLVNVVSACLPEH